MADFSIASIRRFGALNIAFIVLLAAALFLGGASRLHELRVALLELASLPLLVIALSHVMAQAPRPTRLALLLAAAAACVPLIQLVPMPPQLWSALPGRQEPALALQLAGLQPVWAPLSLTPERTWRAFLALLPPVAMFMGFGLLDRRLHLRAIGALLIFAVASVILGTAQLASGGDRLYLWPTTRLGNVVGFFANRNHLATLCLLTIPFAGVLGARVLRQRADGQRLTFWLSIVFIAMMVLALGVIRSRMGIALLAPTLAVTLLAAWIASGGGRPKPLLLGLVAGAALAIGGVLTFALAPLLARFDASGASEGRFENWPTVLQAAEKYLPVGSGLGSFDPVYRSVEPLALLDSTFFNQAHNEYLELWLESGWLGAVLVGVFFVWFTRRTWTAWRAQTGLYADLQRASSIAIGVVLAHSLVDYPLRTITFTVLVALCCALLDMAGQPTRDQDPRTRRRVRI